jgi:serine protease AprX
VRKIILKIIGIMTIGMQLAVAAPLQHQRTSARVWSHESYIVQAKSTGDAIAAVRGVGARATHELEIINAVAATLTEKQVARLRSNPGLTLSLNKAAKVASTDVQPYAVEHTQANRLHASGITGRGVTIAFLDTGWWSQKAVQQDTRGRNVVLQGYDAIGNTVGVGAPSDHYGHGTHVLSIATNSALAADGTYIGIAPDAARVVVRAFDQNGGGTYANTIRGIQWILNNASRYNIRVVNMSFGATPQSYYWDDPLAQAVMKLWQAGIVVVAAAGNSGPAAQTIDVPGNVPYVITVGATTDNYTPNDPSNNRLASFSSTGPTYEGFVKPEIVAPGGHVIAVLQGSSTIAQAHPTFLGTNGYLGSSYFYMSGTSMSAAVVSGTVALMLQAQPDLKPDQVKCKLMSSAHTAIKAAGQLAYSVFQQGAGEIDAYAAVFEQDTTCANAGLNVAADLAGTQHFGGPANLGSDGNYYIMDMQGSAWGTPASADGYTWNQGYPGTHGYTWSQGYTWAKGYTWSQGYTWAKGYTWSQGYTWAKGYTWSQGYTWSKSLSSASTVGSSSLLASPTSINAWVSNE